LGESDFLICWGKGKQPKREREKGKRVRESGRQGRKGEGTLKSGRETEEAEEHF
jgi:hypothetical protein